MATIEVNEMVQRQRIVIVTGVSQGIGLEIAKIFLKNGDFVFGCSELIEGEAEHVQKLLNEYSDSFSYQTVDMSVTEEIEGFIKQVDMQFGVIDVLISNAGKNVFMGIDCSKKDWDYNFSLNLQSHWYIAKCAKPMLKASNGVVIVITSNHAFYTIRGCAPYNIAKRALLSLVQSIQIEWGPEIRAVGIAPGFIDTKGNQAWFDSQLEPSVAREITINSHPVGRIGTPEEVGDLCLFLASNKAGFIAGTTIVMDGGRSAVMQD